MLLAKQEVTLRKDAFGANNAPPRFRARHRRIRRKQKKTKPASCVNLLRHAAKRRQQMPFLEKT